MVPGMACMVCMVPYDEAIFSMFTINKVNRVVYSRIEWERFGAKKKSFKRLGSIQKPTSIQFFFVFLCVQNPHTRRSVLLGRNGWEERVFGLLLLYSIEFQLKCKCKWFNIKTQPFETKNGCFIDANQHHAARNVQMCVYVCVWQNHGNNIKTTWKLYVNCI